MQSCPAQGRQGKGKSGVELKGMGVSLRGKHIRGELKKCFVKRSALPTSTRPPTLPGVDTQPVQGHTRAGPCRGGTGLFKPLLDILLSSGLCHKGFVLLQVPIKHTRSQRAFFGGTAGSGAFFGGAAGNGEIPFPCTSGAPSGSRAQHQDLC